MKITPNNAAMVLDFDLGGIVRFALEVSKAADVRGPGHLAAIRKSAFEVRSFAKSLAATHDTVLGLVPDAAPLPAEWTQASLRSR